MGRLLPALKMLPQSLLPFPLPTPSLLVFPMLLVSQLPMLLVSPMASQLVSLMASQLVSLTASQLVLLLPLLPPLLLLLLPVRQASPLSRPTPAMPSSTEWTNCSLLREDFPLLRRLWYLSGGMSN